jgi:hypothetical protein
VIKPFSREGQRQTSWVFFPHEETGKPTESAWMELFYYNLRAPLDATPAFVEIERIYCY